MSISQDLSYLLSRVDLQSWGNTIVTELALLFLILDKMFKPFEHKQIKLDTRHSTSGIQKYHTISVFKPK